MYDAHGNRTMRTQYSAFTSSFVYIPSTDPIPGLFGQMWVTGGTDLGQSGSGLSKASISAVSIGKSANGGVEVFDLKVGPEHVGHDQL